MADRVTLPGAGKSVLTDEVTDGVLGTGHAQLVKLVDGTIDSAEKIKGTEANGLWVDVTRIADGADVALGSTTDAAITTDTDGTAIGFLRGIVKILRSVWDNVNGAIKVTLVADEPVASDPVVSYQTTASVASGASTTLDSDQIASGKIGYLTGIVVSSSVPFKAELQTVANGIPSTTKVTRVAEHGWDWNPPTKNYLSVAADAGPGLDGFRLVFTSLEPFADAADCYVTFFYDQI